MRHRRSDVLDHAVELLDSHGLAALTMRRLGTELGVQPSAIYHHFDNKQTLLAAVADEILARGARPRTSGEWPDLVREICGELRESMLACTDGADVVATVWAFGLGAQGPAEELEQTLRKADIPEELVLVASRTLLHYVFGHAFEEQTARQAVSLGAVERELDTIPDFDLGLDLVIDGLHARLARA
ncbi:MAG: TetR family transcriptional regulator [Nocardioides sp.]|nr:TetR family transcriptional regulator [Nocardioides sp.]